MLPLIETDRVVLRPVQLLDAGSYYQLERDAEVKKFVGGPLNRPFEAVLESIRAQGPYHGSLAVLEKGTGSFAGRCGLLVSSIRTDEAELHIVLAKRYWGQGLATEIAKSLIAYGFEVLGLKAMTAIVHPDNVASMRVLQKVGFQYVDSYHATRPGDWKEGFPQYRIEGLCQNNRSHEGGRYPF